MNKKSDNDKEVSSNSNLKKDAGVVYGNVYVKFEDGGLEEDVGVGCNSTINNIEEISEYDSEYDVEVIEVENLPKNSASTPNIVSEISSVVESVRGSGGNVVDSDCQESELIPDDEITEIDDTRSRDTSIGGDDDSVKDNVSVENIKHFFSESVKTEDSLGKVILILFVVFGVLITLYIMKVLL